MALIDVDVNVADIQESITQTITDIQQSFNQAMTSASAAFSNAYQFIQNSLNDAQEKRNWAYQYTRVTFGLKTESEYNDYCSERFPTLSDELAQMKPHWFLNASLYIGHGLARLLFKDSIISLLNHVVRCANFLLDPTVPFINAYDDHTDEWKQRFTFKKLLLEGIGHLLSIPIYAATLVLGFLGLRKQGLMQIYAAADKVSSWLSRLPSDQTLITIFSPLGGVFGLIGASLVMFEGVILLIGGISNKGLTSVRIGWRRANGQLDKSQFTQPFWKGGLLGITLGSLAFCTHLALKLSVCIFSNMGLGIMASLTLAKWFVLNQQQEGDALLLPKSSSASIYTRKHFLRGGFFALPIMGLVVSIGLGLSVLGISQQGFKQVLNSLPKAWSFLTSKPGNQPFETIFDFHGGLLGNFGSLIILASAALLAALGFSNKGMHSIRLGVQGKLSSDNKEAPAFLMGGLLGVILGFTAYVCNKTIQLIRIVTHNMRVAISDSWKIGKWVIGVSDNDAPLHLQTFWQGGFFALPCQLVIINSAVILAILGLTKNGFSQFKNSFEKAWSFVSSKTCPKSYSLILHPQGGLLGTLGSAAVLTGSFLLTIFGVSNKGIHSIQLGIQGKLSSADKLAPAFWKGGVFGVVLGLTAFTLSRGAHLFLAITRNMGAATHDSWKIGKWVVGAADNSSAINLKTFNKGGFFALPFQLVIINSAVLLAILGLSNNGLSQFKKSFAKAKSFVGSSPCLESYSSILHPKGGVLGTVGSGAVLAASGLLAALGLSNKGINSIKLGMRGTLSSEDKSIPAFWKGGIFGVTLGLTAFAISKGIQLTRAIAQNMGTAISDSWQVGKWVVGVSDNSSLINSHAFCHGGFFGLPFQLIIINSAAILAILGLTKNGFSQFKKSFEKALSFVSMKTCSESYSLILHPKGGLLGTLGSAVMLTGSLLLIFFGLSNKGLHSIQLGIHGKLSSEDKLAPAFWKGGVLGVTLGFTTFTIFHGIQLIMTVSRNMVTAIDDSWKVGKWVLGVSDNSSAIHLKAFSQGGFFALPCQLIIINSAVILAVLGITNNGLAQFKKSFAKAKSFVGSKQCLESYSAILHLKGGLLGTFGSGAILTVGGVLTVLGLSKKGINSIKLGMRATLSSEDKSIPAFWKGGVFGVCIGLTAFAISKGIQLIRIIARNMGTAIRDSWNVGKWVVGASNDNSSINSKAFWHGGFFALPLQILIVGIAGLFVVAGLSKNGFNQFGHSIAKGISLISAKQNHTTLKSIFHPKGGVLGIIGSAVILTGAALLACLGFSNKGFNSIKLGIKGSLSSQDKNSPAFWKGGVFGASLGLTAYCISKVIQIISITMANVGENLSKSLTLSLWMASGTDYEKLPLFSKKCFIKGGFLAIPLMGLFLFTSIAISSLGLTKFAVKSTRFGFATAKHLLVGSSIDDATKLSCLEFLRGGIIGVTLGLAPLVGLGLAYIGVAIPLVAMFRVVKRAFQAVKSVCKAMGIIKNSPSETVQQLEGLKQFSITNPEAWRRPVSHIDKHVKRHLSGAKNSGGYTLSFWNGLQKDIYRTISLNVSSLREQVIAIITRYAKRHEQFDVSGLREVEMDNLVFDNPLIFQNLNDEIAQFFQDNGRSLTRLKERFQSRMTENEFKINIVQSLKYAGTLFAPRAARGDIQEFQYNLEVGGIASLT